MSFLDDLKKSREEVGSAYIEFLHKFPKDGIYAFFEGDGDSSFYMGFIHQQNTQNLTVFPIDCGGKKLVYQAHNEVHSHIAKTQRANTNIILLFFVDKDYSDILEESYEVSNEIFVTACYSVENYVVSEFMLQRIWDDFFYIQNATVDFDNIKTKFANELQEFHSIMKPLVAHILHAKMHNLQFRQSDIKLNRLFSFEEDLTVKTRQDTDIDTELQSMCGISIAPSTDIINELLNKLDYYSPKQYIRGKFELWFFVQFLIELRKQLKEAVLVSDEFKVHDNIGSKNALRILGPRAKIPPSLNEFLTSNLGFS